MATVTLSELWVHLAADLSNHITVYMGALSEESGVTGEVRRYANGVTRAVSSVGANRSIQVDLPYLDRADLTLLESWAGQPVMVRDPLGRKVFGTYFIVEASERPLGDVDTVSGTSLTLNALSLSEEV